MLLLIMHVKTGRMYLISCMCYMLSIVVNHYFGKNMINRSEATEDYVSN